MKEVRISFSLSLSLGLALALALAGLSRSLTLLARSLCVSLFFALSFSLSPLSLAKRMDDFDVSPISETGDVFGRSVICVAASGSSAPEFIRLPDCETTTAHSLTAGKYVENAPQGRESDNFTWTTMEAKHHHRRPCTARLCDPKVQKRLHVPGS